jgi:hypothetical protein
VTCSCHTSPGDPTLEVAERQLAMLSELAQMVMVASRAHTAASVAAAHAVEVILADEYWQPETGRARALAGSKDAADALQKVSRALRLTLKLEMAAAETLRDIRAGIVTHTAPPKTAGETSPIQNDVQNALQDGRGPAGSFSGDRETETTRAETNTERLVEIDRPDVLPRTPFHETVHRICAEVGAPVDWAGWKVGPPIIEYRALQPRPPGWSECRPPASYTRCLERDPADSGPARPP